METKQYSVNLAWRHAGAEDTDYVVEPITRHVSLPEGSTTLNAAEHAVHNGHYFPTGIGIDHEGKTVEIIATVAELPSANKYAHLLTKKLRLTLRNPFRYKLTTAKFAEVCQHMLNLKAIGYYRCESNQSLDIGELYESLRQEQTYLATEMNTFGEYPNAVKWAFHLRQKNVPNPKWKKIVVLTKEATNVLFPPTRPVAYINQSFMDRANEVYRAMGQLPDASTNSTWRRRRMEFQTFLGHMIFIQEGR